MKFGVINYSSRANAQACAVTSKLAADITLRVVVF